MSLLNSFYGSGEKSTINKSKYLFGDFLLAPSLNSKLKVLALKKVLKGL